MFLLMLWGLQAALATGAVVSLFQPDSKSSDGPKTRVLAVANPDNPIPWTAVELLNLAALRSASIETGTDLTRWIPRLQQGSRTVFRLSETARNQSGFALIVQNPNGTCTVEEWVPASADGEELRAMAEAIAEGIGHSRDPVDSLRLIPIGNTMQQGYLQRSIR